MTKREKQIQDAVTLRKYEERLRAQRKIYSQSASAVSEGGRRNRALSLGECCLQAIDQLQELNGSHKLIPGTLFWNIDEHRVTMENGRKGYMHTVVYHVKADEQALTEQEIAEEIEETRKRIKAETEEMFTDEEPGGGDPAGPEEEEGKVPEEEAENGGGDPAESAAPWDE